MAFGIGANGPDAEARVRLDGAAGLAKSILAKGSKEDVLVVTCGGCPELTKQYGYKSLAHAGAEYLSSQLDTAEIHILPIALNKKTNTAIDLVAIDKRVYNAPHRITIVTSKWCMLRQWAIASLVFGRPVRVYPVRSALSSRAIQREFLRHELPGMIIVPQRVYSAKRVEQVYV